MLLKIAKVYGGYVRKIIEKNSSYVQWIVNDQKTFHSSILPLLEEYNPSEACFASGAIASGAIATFALLPKQLPIGTFALLAKQS
jgi:hypothetical protein